MNELEGVCAHADLDTQVNSHHNPFYGLGYQKGILTSLIM